ncbi:Outer membrane cobalamin receptor protein [Candidatus Ornithobacterium hominis]|uniref:TonB-dependent receptor domain-containing protein n=1 Tax=Candidatus Ornithobacterium hominis TaxID=2497989 RepID=UPI000E5B24CF|nr:outer membrane beta-barrel family protein [Candidatus Ornithobacterium hominis]SZD73246.1 Outer membrane cobalamin receptor protein [Candidatus Ornithobacterium hominis]
MKSFILGCIALFISLGLSAQSFSLSGKVEEPGQTPLAYANVVIKNNHLQDGVMTMEDGSFIIENLPSGIYELSISFLGYETFEKTVELNQTLDIGTVTLQENPVELETVTVIGYKKLIKNDKGKTTLNVEGTMLTSMPTSEVLLNFVPGVKSFNGEIEVLGKGKPLVFIDEKEVKSPQQIEMLRPEDVKNITVDRNPSAKYDAQYSSIIHIVTNRKSSEQNWAIQLGHSSALNRNYNHSEEVHLYHNKGIFHNYIGYKFKNQRETERVKSFQHIFANNSKQSNLYDAQLNANDKIHTLTMGSNMQLSENHHLDLQYLFTQEDHFGKITGEEAKQGIINEAFEVSRTGKDKDQRHLVNLNYQWKINNSSKLGFYADYTHKKSSGGEKVHNYNSVGLDEHIDLDNQSKFDVWLLRSEYKKEFDNGLGVELGTKLSTIDSKAFVFIQPENKSLQIQNHTKLSEHTLAGYGILSKQWEKWYAEAGIRAEQNRAEYQKNENSIWKKPRVLNNLLPSMTINYDVSEKLALQLHYTQKIIRPSFGDLDPSVSYLSTALLERGNPLLKPTVKNSIELSSTINDKWNIGISYNLNKDAIVYLMQKDEQNPNRLIHEPLNLDKISSWDINASYAARLGRLNLNLAGNISFPDVAFPYQGEIKKNTLPKYELMTNGVYMFSPNAILFGTFVARSKYHNINTTFDPIYNLILGANFKFLKGKLQMTVFANDALGLAYGNTFSEYGYVRSGQKVNLDKRMIGVKLKYNIFNLKKKFKETELSEEEIKRIQ